MQFEMKDNIEINVTQPNATLNFPSLMKELFWVQFTQNWLCNFFIDKFLF